jgi:hypothetical protein
VIAGMMEKLPILLVMVLLMWLDAKAATTDV